VTTRRQDTEFHSFVHPISGRIHRMDRGDANSTPIVYPMTRTRQRAAQLARTTRNPEVRRRAEDVLDSKGGPQLVSVHNHPGTDGAPRAYPSAQDTSLHARVSAGSRASAHVQGHPSIPHRRTVVLSHEPGPRGSKQTRAVTMRGEVAPRFQREAARHDLATQPEDLGINSKTLIRSSRSMLHRQANPGPLRRTVQRGAQSLSSRPGSLQRAAQQVQRITTPEVQHFEDGKPMGWNKFMSRATGTPDNRTGLYSTETLHKRAVDAFGVYRPDLIAKAKVPYAELPPFERMRVHSAQQARIRRKFARKYGPGEHDIAVGQLRRLSGSRRDFSDPEHKERVEQIMPSMRQRGLDQPVEVRRYRPAVGSNPQVEADFYSGGHRLEAARRLGWPRVRTAVSDEQ